MMKLLTLLLASAFCCLSNAQQRPPIQQAVFFQETETITDYLVSEKLDGVRGYWTGKKLLSKSGKPIAAPKWFTQGWPEYPIDGELWSKRGEFQSIVSCVRRLPENQHGCWKDLTFNVFDLPKHGGVFNKRYLAIINLVNHSPSKTLSTVPQQPIQSVSWLNQLLKHTISIGGEGLMLHHKNAMYRQGRNPYLMKYKDYQDAEAVVVAHITGKGKYLNQLGALLVKMPNGKQFKIGTGFTDHDRKFPPAVGSIVTYRYIGLTNRGIPKFASFIRIKESL